MRKLKITEGEETKTNIGRKDEKKKKKNMK